MKKKNIIICILSAAVLAAVLIVLTLTVFVKNRGGETVINDNRTVILNACDISLEVGETETLTAKLSVGKGKFVWTSSDESVA